jgi:hypothetical protein
MKAELLLMGKRVDMARRTRRRTLVVLIYAGLTALIAGLYFVDQWHSTGSYVFFAGILVCRLFLGGYFRGGLIKPFSGKGPRAVKEATPLMPLLLQFGLYRPDPDASAYRNDERETHQRDHAHFRAYQVIGLALVVIWTLALFRMDIPHLLARSHVPMDQLIYGVALFAIMLFFTLPQAILLWT